MKEIFGKPMAIISENDDNIVFNYDGKEHTMSKHGLFDSETRYLQLNGKTYNEIGFVVNDGYAVCNEYEDESGYLVVYGDGGDKITAKFPTKRQILLNEEYLKGALSYFAELNGYYNDKEILSEYLESTWDKNIVVFFEGFFFYGNEIDYKVK